MVASSHVRVNLIGIRFLLVNLQAEYVLEQSDPIQIRKRLKCLPKSPAEGYRTVLERLPPGTKGFAFRMMGWIFHAPELLRRGQLREALAVDVGDEDLDRETVPSPEAVIRVCGGLVDYDRSTELVTFSHETVRPYLEEYELGSLPTHLDLCRTCLVYLSFPAFSDPVESEISLESTTLGNRFDEFDFLRYAAIGDFTHWLGKN
jgi:hypothetical protein